jgi:hypothetical protein
MQPVKRLLLLSIALTAASFFTVGSGMGWAIDVCGNGICAGNATPRETCSTCPEDCGPCATPVCGDWYCDPNSSPAETCQSCPGDCGACPDQDADGVPDSQDNCKTTYNPNQADCDHDGIGDACDSLNGTQSSITSSSVTNVQYFGTQCYMNFSFGGSNLYDNYRFYIRTCYGTRTTYCNGSTADSWSGYCQDSGPYLCNRSSFSSCTGAFSYPPYQSCPF